MQTLRFFNYAILLFGWPIVVINVLFFVTDLLGITDTRGHEQVVAAARCTHHFIDGQIKTEAELELCNERAFSE